MTQDSCICIYQGSPLAAAKATATLPGVQTHALTQKDSLFVNGRWIGQSSLAVQSKGDCLHCLPALLAGLTPDTAHTKVQTQDL